MAGRWMTESSPMASDYFLRKTWAGTSHRVTQVGPGVRPATLHVKARAARTGCGCNVLCGDRSRNGKTSSGPSSVRVKKASLVFRSLSKGPVDVLIAFYCTQ